MNISRRALVALIGAASALAGTTAFGAGKGTISISMPNKSSSRWIHDGQTMEAQFKAAGYDVDCQYAEDDIPAQLSQFENMITEGVKALVIAAIDGTTLSNALANAKAAGIIVVAYDRLIRQSGDVDYYTTFDNFQVGVLQANWPRSPSRWSTRFCRAARRRSTTPRPMTTASWLCRRTCWFRFRSMRPTTRTCW